ncbi:hypothetical protein [Mammaliicoccus fleurettii]|uniref:hypothetical protein n=1 Tax=Mammaliicoccus fleurettii TaxID=150056 RepID=UPI001300ED5F|nr:hypothetical protein [Mammaliicoccus fleurettii]
MEKVFKVISHITIAVVIWKIYKLEQKSSFEKMIKEYQEIQYKKAVEMGRNFMKR